MSLALCTGSIVYRIDKRYEIKIDFIEPFRFQPEGWDFDCLFDSLARDCQIDDEDLLE
jgi:hypothetical protein